jgi:hypothetical protein
VVEAERQQKEAEDRGGDTHPMETDIPEMSTTDIGTNISGGGLRLGLWEPFQPSEVLDLRSFTYDNKTC